MVADLRSNTKMARTRMRSCDASLLTTSVKRSTVTLVFATNDHVPRPLKPSLVDTVHHGGPDLIRLITSCGRGRRQEDRDREDQRRSDVLHSWPHPRIIPWGTGLRVPARRPRAAHAVAVTLNAPSPRS